MRRTSKRRAGSGGQRFPQKVVSKRHCVYAKGGWEVVCSDGGQMLVEVKERGRVKFFGWTSEEKKDKKKKNTKE